jgi:hypothetical protein
MKLSMADGYSVDVFYGGEEWVGVLEIGNAVGIVVQLAGDGLGSSSSQDATPGSPEDTDLHQQLNRRLGGTETRATHSVAGCSGVIRVNPSESK